MSRAARNSILIGLIGFIAGIFLPTPIWAHPHPPINIFVAMMFYITRRNNW